MHLYEVGSFVVFRDAYAFESHSATAMMGAKGQGQKRKPLKLNSDQIYRVVDRTQCKRPISENDETIATYTLGTLRGYPARLFQLFHVGQDLLCPWPRS